MRPATDVRRVSTISREALVGQYVVENLPVIVTSDSAIQEAAKRWSLDYMVAQHPHHHKVSVEFYGDGANTTRHQSMTLGEYVSLIRNPAERARYYLAQQPLSEVLPNLAKDVAPPDFLGEEDGAGLDPVVFIGIDTFTGAHYHDTPREAVLMQIVGTKKVVLCPAEQYRCFYPREWFSAQSNCSKVPFESQFGDIREHGPVWMPKDADKIFSRLDKATVLECVLGPGELLYIPQGWFHIVYGFGESISLTYFWRGSWRNAYWRIALRDVLSGKRWKSIHAKIDAKIRAKTTTD